MNGFRVGLGTQLLNTRLSPTAMVHATYLVAVASGVDSYWVADHPIHRSRGLIFRSGTSSRSGWLIRCSCSRSA
jgi:hypothetical protein